MLRFTSARERRLWLAAAAVVAVVFATLGFATSLQGALRERALSDAFWVGLWLIVAAIVVVGWARRGGRAVGVGLAVSGAVLIALLRLATPEQRSHLVEYGMVALLVYEALRERGRNGAPVRAAAAVAVALTLAVGVLDEAVQAVLPTRVFDPVDIGFDLVAAVLAVGGSAALRWVRDRAMPR